MSISNIQSVVITGALLRSGCVNEFNNTLLIIDSNNGLIRQFDMSTLSRVEPYCPLSNTQPIAMALLSPASAMVGFSGSNALDIVELSGGYRFSTTLAQTMPSQSNTVSKGQQMAADPINKIGIAVTTTTTISIINGNNFTSYSPTNLSFRSGTQPSCVILKETGKFLIGTSQGEIYEIDLFGNPVRRMILTNPNTSGTQNTAMNPRIVTMAYDNNMLIVTTETGLIYTIDWSTGTELRINSSTSSAQGFLLSNSASGVCLGAVGAVTTVNKLVAELDFTVGNTSIGLAPALLNSGAQIIDLGIHTQTGRAWVIQQTTTSPVGITPIIATVFFMDLNVRPTAIRTITAPAPFARVTIIDLTTDATYLDTYMSSPGSYRIPTGKSSLLEYIKIGDGATALWDLSRYST